MNMNIFIKNLFICVLFANSLIYSQQFAENAKNAVWQRGDCPGCPFGSLPGTQMGQIKNINAKLVQEAQYPHGFRAEMYDLTEGSNGCQQNTSYRVTCKYFGSAPKCTINSVSCGY